MNQLMLLILFISVTVATSQSSCAATTCLVGTMCVERGGRARCVDPSENPNSGQQGSCAATTCAVGTMCVESGGRVRCVDPSEIPNSGGQPSSCAATTCLVGTVCVERGGRASCVQPTGGNQNNRFCNVKFEEWRQCAGCEPTCQNKRPFCSRGCAQSRCQCRQGFYRTRDGECVTENDCDAAAQAGSPRFRRSSQSPKCGKNMRFSECSSPCPAKCGEYDVPPCPPSCGPPKCECKPAFFLNREGECVKRENCETEAAPSVTCANVDCVSGFVCKMTSGEPKCFPGNSVTCNGIQCDVGHHCEIIKTVPTCVRKPKHTCATVLCVEGGCKDTPSGPQCGGPLTSP